ncbi:MAG: hypothetical protein R2748_24230 [Bryobacterales bacterium]
MAELLARLAQSPWFCRQQREGEEAMVAQAFGELQAAPAGAADGGYRHPQRFDEAYETLCASGLPVVRRSALGEPPALPAIMLLDSLGELSSLYASASVVFVGGSLNGWGGHNVLEPALFEKPVVVGPAMQNFRDIADRLLAADALVQIEDAAGLAPAFAALLDDPKRAAEIGARGRAVAKAERGATERVLEQTARLLCEAAPIELPSLPRRMALRPLSWIWSAGAALHRKTARPRRLPRFTLCGQPELPAGRGRRRPCWCLAERLALRGYAPAILTRGYRRASKEPSCWLSRLPKRTRRVWGMRPLCWLSV